MMEKMRGDPLSVGTLEEFIDDNHAIVSGAHGPEYYTTVMSFVDKDQLEPGCSILMNNKSNFHFFLFTPIFNLSSTTKI